MRKIRFNFNTSNITSCILATIFYIGYCFVGYSKVFFPTKTIWQYWVDSALFIDGKMLIVLFILCLPYIKAFIEGTYLNNKSILTIFK